MDSLDKRFALLDSTGRAGYLIGGFISRTLTIAEEEELHAWILESEPNMQLFEDMTDEPMIDSFMQWLASKKSGQ